MEVIKKYVEEQRYKEMLLQQQDAVRQRVIKARRANPRSWLNVSREMGISHQALLDFRIGTRETSFLTMCKIDDWLALQEKK